jgi:AcrR family transcriptional regulator
MARAASSIAESPPDTREKIVEAALEVFADKGFDASSTREIASRVGVNHGLIPYYFGSKQKLWRAAVDHAFLEMQGEIDAMDDRQDEPGPRERAARMIRAHVRFVARRPAFVRLMYEEGKRRGERMRWMVDRHIKPLYEAVVRIQSQVPRPGSPAGAAPEPELSPVHFFYVLAGASGLIFHQAEECRRVSGVDPFDPEVVEAHAHYVERILLGPAPDETARGEETPS